MWKFQKFRCLTQSDFNTIEFHKDSCMASAKALSDNFDYVNEDSISEDLKCPICSSPFVEPADHPGINENCGQLFCFGCVMSCVRCPTCRSFVSKWQQITVTAVSQKMLLRPLAALKVRCKTCQAIVERGDSAVHTEKCPKVCSRGCGKLVAPINFSDHLLQCTHVVLSCEANSVGCKWIGYRGQSHDHQMSCVHYILRDVLSYQLESIKLLEQRCKGQQILNDAIGKQLKDQETLISTMGKQLKDQETLITTLGKQVKERGIFRSTVDNKQKETQATDATEMEYSPMSGIFKKY